MRFGVNIIPKKINIDFIVKLTKNLTSKQKLHANFKLFHSLFILYYNTEMGNEVTYICPKCNKSVYAMEQFKGLPCLQCNGISNWQPALQHIASSIQQQSGGNIQQSLKTGHDLMKQQGLLQVI